MSKQQQLQLLEICSYHPEVLEKYRKKEFVSFDFFAFNLNTQQALQVTVQGDLLYLSTEDIEFSVQEPDEQHVISKLQKIISGVSDGHALSEHAQKYRGCLRNVLSLYSRCIEDDPSGVGGETLPAVPLSQEEHASHSRRALGNAGTGGVGVKRHQISFIELTFSVDRKPNYTNNFAAIVPIHAGRDGVLTAMLPFNGSLWEEDMHSTQQEKAKCFIRSRVCPGTAECDARVTQLRQIYNDRLMMMSGKQVLIPFTNIVSGRERHLEKKKETYMILRQNTETYLMLYGTLVSIGRSHKLMTEHDMCMTIVKNVLLTTVNIFGHAADVSNNDLMDSFFGIMCYAMHIGQLGHTSYREDILGEDIRKRCVCVRWGLPFLWCVCAFSLCVSLSVLLQHMGSHGALCATDGTVGGAGLRTRLATRCLRGLTAKMRCSRTRRLCALWPAISTICSGECGGGGRPAHNPSGARRGGPLVGRAHIEFPPA